MFKFEGNTMIKFLISKIYFTGENDRGYYGIFYLLEDRLEFQDKAISTSLLIRSWLKITQIFFPELSLESPLSFLVQVLNDFFYIFWFKKIINK